MEYIHKFLSESGVLVKHHVDSFNHFTDNISSILAFQNPFVILKNKQSNGEFLYTCNMYVGGEDGTDIQIGHPVYTENDIQKPLYPNDARLRNLTYAFSIHARLTFKFSFGKSVEDIEFTSPDYIFLGLFPIMIQSNLCYLTKDKTPLPPDVRFNMGECTRDQGGYFIIDGSEKVIVSQEGRSFNAIVTTKNYDDSYYYSADIKSASEDKSQFPRVTAVRIATHPVRTKTSTSYNQVGNHEVIHTLNEHTINSMPTTDGYTLHQIVVELPDVRDPIPLFIVMRALGIITDKQIINVCLLGDASLMPYLHNSICNAGNIYTQSHALEFIGSYTKYTSVNSAMSVLSELFLPHIGSLNFVDKAYFLGHMVKKVLRLATGIDPITDRDSLRMKRVTSTGMLITDLFNDYYNQQLKHIGREIDTAHNKNDYNNPDAFAQLFINNYHSFFLDRITETGVRKGFKGNWGATNYTRKVGVSQKLDRISFNSAISHLRTCVLQMDSSAKITTPRLLHGSQWGIYDPVQTNGDTHKHLSLCTEISIGFKKQVVLDEIDRLLISIVPLSSTTPENISQMVKVFLNGHWIGCVVDPVKVLADLLNSRRCGRLPYSTSISWNILETILYITTDGGRPIRPLFYIDANRKLNTDKTKSWPALVHGTDASPRNIEYMDSEEANTALITFDKTLDFNMTRHTHVEIHGAIIFGFMGNLIIHPENNQLPRNAFSCGQSKQAVSVYNTNYQNRMDTMGAVLNYGQDPLIQSSLYEPLGTLPYGVNAIVAIMCYTGYNTEDAILLNRSSLERGMFNTSYFKTYEDNETETENTSTLFEGGESTDKNGLVPMDTVVTPNTVLMRTVSGGKVRYKYPKIDQLGRVDRTFITENVPGRRIAKVRICHVRSPGIGDKFASRAGQKGTCGLIVDEENMPFTADGVRPDIIINPHALPSRMTIGQLIESLVGKANLHCGTKGDCTAFNVDKDTDEYRQKLTQLGYHNSGNELLYNGMTGDAIESSIYIGPTYYLWLKHMVEDKINFRGRGPITSLTRQPVQGRSNEGGLRIGEMERDGVIANGMASFVQDSMMARGDGTMLTNNTRKPYTVAVDNSTGLLAAYNAFTNVKFSPTLDDMTFQNSVNVTNPIHERTFSELNVPYSFKLLLHELTAMNVQARMLTSDSVDQYKSMHSTWVESKAKQIISDFISTLYSMTNNTLFVSIDDSVPCQDMFMLFNQSNKVLNPTIFPWLSLPNEFEKVRYAIRDIVPVPDYTSDFQRERSELLIYKSTPESFDTTLNYYLNKMKTGVLVRIKNNKVFNFLPLYNVAYTNDFYKSVDNIDAFIDSLPKRKRQMTSKMPQTWHATNCLVRTEFDDRDPTDQYLAHMYDMFVETCSHKQVNDCVFFITRKDFPHLRNDWKEAFDAIYGDANLPDEFHNKPFLPCVAQCTAEGYADFTIPTGDDWQAINPDRKFATYGYKNLRCDNNSTPRDTLLPWNNRQDMFVWRGKGTGCGNTVETNPRMHLHSLDNPHLDAKITRYTDRIKGTFIDGKLGLEYNAPTNDGTGKQISMLDQTKNKFIINVEGNAAAYRFGGLLGLGFCVINIKSKFALWFEPLIKMRTIHSEDIAECHCIEVAHDLSDLNETIEWCLENDEVCKKISENATVFYNTHFTPEFVHTYIADLFNTMSSMTSFQKNMYDIDQGETLKALRGKPQPNKFKLYKEPDVVSTDTTVIIVPYRDSGDQDRSLQLERFLGHYKNIKILIVEQSDDGYKFNRGALLNAGFDYVNQHMPNITSFVFHDVDIMMDEHIIQRYYGSSDKDIVHIGSLVKSSKYNTMKYFLGRIIRFSKKGYLSVNGFPNTFYGWGGEDDALLHRIGKNIVHRPDESLSGYEIQTKNDIVDDTAMDRKESNKHEQLLADSLQWKIEGVNSLQYSVVLSESVAPLVQKITIQLVPAEVKHVTEIVIDDVITDVADDVIGTVDTVDDTVDENLPLSVLSETTTLNIEKQDKLDIKVIHIAT